jgi:hypothetical protein
MIDTLLVSAQFSVCSFTLQHNVCELFYFFFKALIDTGSLCLLGSVQLFRHSIRRADVRLDCPLYSASLIGIAMESNTNVIAENS